MVLGLDRSQGIFLAMHIARRPAGTRPAANLDSGSVAPIRRTDDEVRPGPSAPSDLAYDIPTTQGPVPKPVAVLARTYAQLRSEGPVVAGVVARRGRVAASRLRLLAGSASSLLSGGNSNDTLAPEDRLESLAVVDMPVEVPPALVGVPPAAVEVPPPDVEAPTDLALPADVDVPIEVDAPVPMSTPVPALSPLPGASSTALVASAKDPVGPVETALPAEPVGSEPVGSEQVGSEQVRSEQVRSGQVRTEAQPAGIITRAPADFAGPSATTRVETAVAADFALLGLNPTDLTPGRRRRRVRAELLVAAGVVAVLVAAFLLILAGRDRHESADAGYSPLPSSASITSATAPLDVGSSKAGSSAGSNATIHRHDAIKWMQANLYPTDSIAADTPTAVELGRYGFRNVHAVDGAHRIAARVQFVAAAGNPSAAATTLHALLAKSIPVATFGSGADATTVSEVQSADAKALARMLSKNRTARLAAGRQLSLNSRLTVAPAVRPVIKKGSLDLRAETLLALLTQNGDVRLDAAPQDAAERHADVPIRIVVVTVKDVKKARTTIAGLPAGYHAESMQDEPGSHLTVEFPVRGVPAMPVS